MLSRHTRWLGTGSAAAATVLAMTACSTTTEQADAEPIQVWLPYGTYFEEAFQTAADACATEGVDVEVTAFDLSYGELDLKVQTDAQAGTAPDLVLAGLNTVIPLQSNDFVVDLTAYTSGSDIFTPDVMPAIASGAIDGVQYVIPWGISVPVIFYNEQILEQNAVDPGALTSWAAVEDAAAAVTAGGDYGVSFPLQEGWLPLQYLLTAGTTLVDESGQPVFSDAAGDRAVEHVNRLYRSGSAFPGDETASREAFAAGEVGMFIGSSAFISSFASLPFEWSTAPFPAETAGGAVVTAAGGAGLAMFATEDRQENAWAAIECAFAPEILAEYAVSTFGYMPVRADMADALEPGLLENEPYAAPWSQFDLVGPWFNFPGQDGPRALATFNDAWVEATQQSDEPTVVMDSAAEQIADLLR